MPLNLKDIRDENERRAGSYLTGRKDESAVEVADAGSRLTAGREGFLNARVPELAAAAGAQYNLSPMTGAVASETARTRSTDLKKTADSQLAERTVTGDRDRLNKIYSYAMDRFVNSGMDRNMAEQHARQVAFDYMNQDFAAKESEKNRFQVAKKQTMLDQYQGRQIDMINRLRERGASDAIIRSLFGIGGMAIGSYFGGPAGGAAGASVGTASAPTSGIKDPSEFRR
jgi:hypothetical protein